MADPLVSQINSILEKFSKTHDADLTTVQELEWHGVPESTRLKKYAGTDWDPLYQTALAVDMAIIKGAPMETTYKYAVDYINAALHFFRGLSAEGKPFGACKCGGSLDMRINKTTGIGFYSCSRWSSGCKETRTLLGETSSTSLKLGGKPVGRQCPTCKKELVVRLAKQGKFAGKEFIGCSGFPSCRHSESL